MRAENALRFDSTSRAGGTRDDGRALDVGGTLLCGRTPTRLAATAGTGVLGCAPHCGPRLVGCGRGKPTNAAQLLVMSPGQTPRSMTHVFATEPLGRR
ncbi:hypothetical protein [Actinoplanes sp. URMC 104]|uniref:hypothetical protein n=1 Tax=Actinoplanes sp. URMC 104 TaxID=3423409 RepID=UPI003F534D1C